MSAEESAAYLAGDRTKPSQDYAPINEGSDAGPFTNTEQLRRVLNQALHEQDRLPFVGEDEEEDELSFSPGEEQLYTESSPELAAQYFADPETLREQDADAGEAATVQPGLRTDDQIDDDLDVLVGPFALAVTPEDRHRATLRLIDDLVGARQALRHLVGA